LPRAEFHAPTFQAELLAKGQVAEKAREIGVEYKKARVF